MKLLDVLAKDTVIFGDRMGTDIIAKINARIESHYYGPAALWSDPESRSKALSLCPHILEDVAEFMDLKDTKKAAPKGSK